MKKTLISAVAAISLMTGTLAGALAPASAAPATDHPRLWVRSADVAKLRSWATSANPMYSNGLASAAAYAKAHADAKWNWTTGLPASGWNDTGGENWEGDTTEAYAQFFAFMSVVDPSSANRAQWAMRARVLLMYVINIAAAGQSPSAPFRTPGFITGNRANYWGEAWGLTVDWIYPSLSTADKAQIRKVFLRWANEIYTVANRSGTAPLYPGSSNDPRVLGTDATASAYQQQANQTNLRWSVNNYFIGQTRTLALMAMSFDAADDPAIDGTKPVTQVGNSLGSYVGNVIGYWLYQIYATFEDAATAKAALGISGSNMSLGVAAGGLPVEGTLYGESQGFLAEALLGLQTAGYTDTASFGPQAGFFGRPYWDKAVNGFMHMIAPVPYVPSAASGDSYLGPLYSYASYGDMLRTWVEPGSIILFGSLGASDTLNGNTARLAKDRWIAQNVIEGGANSLYSRAGNIWGNSYASHAILYFLTFDPAAAAAPDPRPGLPTEFISPAIGTVLARSDWGPNATWFSYRCSWETINHISGDCGQFSLYRKGTWLTKEWSNYANDWMGYMPMYHNTLALQNDQATISPSIWDATMTWGGQWNNGGYTGDPSTLISANSNWSFAQSDATNLYNHPDWWTASRNALDIQHASRSIVWLNQTHVIAYDRAISGKTGRFKRFNLVTQATPTISGKTARAVANGQALNVQSLLPTTATLREEHFWTTNPAQEVNATAELDTSYDRLVIEDTAKPTTVRFLTVLQGTDASATADTATAFTSTSGAAFDGAWVGNSAVVFPQSITAAVTATSYQVPASVTRHLITGLTPGAGYNVTLTTSGSTTTVALTTGTGYTADAGGVIGLGFPAPAFPPQTGAFIGTALINPNGTGGTGGGTPNPPPPTPSPTCGTVTKQKTNSYIGYCAPLALISNGVYFYDMNGQRVYWQQSSKWQLINDGGAPKTYTQTATGWQGSGAPEQLIANGASYYDTVEQRYYSQVGTVWWLVMPSTTTTQK